MATKQLPKPRTRYYVGEPVIVIPLAQFEQLADHLTDLALLDRKPQNEQAAVRQRHSQHLKACRQDLKAARAYYKITATGRKPRQADDDV